MSGLYHVFLKWTATNDNTAAATEGRYMLRFPSRYDADELFRAMQGLLESNGQVEFSVLTRNSAQFWLYDSPEGWASIVNSANRNDLPAFRDRYSLLLLSDYEGGRNWPMIPNPVIGTDWISGNTFFIRNRRQPDLHWWVNDNNVHVSNYRRSKFRITSTTAGTREPFVLIRADTVTVEVIPETVTGTPPTSTAYVSIGSAGSGGQIVTSSVEMDWNFGTFLNGEIGVKWDVSGQDLNTDADKGVLVQMVAGGFDEWELV